MLDQLLAEARAWLDDCGLSYQEDSDLLTAHLVHAAYDGGWPAFIRADPGRDEDQPTIWLLMVRDFGLETANMFFPSHES